MKKILVILLCAAVVLAVAGCAKKASVEEAYIGNLKVYVKMDDGTWACDGRTYRYRLEVRGKMPGAAVESVFTYLSNLDSISFEQAYMAAGLSSDSEDYFPPEKAVLVDMK